MPLLQSLIDLLFPRTCPGCGHALKAGERAVCISCLLEMPATHFHLNPKNNPLFFRLAGRVPLEAASAMYYFDKHGRLKRVVSSLKYRKNPKIGYELGRMIGETIHGQDWVKDLQAVVPVPLHPKRKAERGYNQSAALGQGLALSLGIPLLSESLVRVVNTKTQTRKGKTERWENVESAFQRVGEIPGHVLLMDDIITTGATTEACIRALQQHSDQKVSLMALAMAR